MQLKKAAPPPAPEEELAPEVLVMRHVRNILASPSANPDAEMPEAIRDLPGMKDLHDLLWGIRNLTTSLSHGDLDYHSSQKGYVMGTLKAFQSNLRHLTWQTQCIAKGEYNHRVNFLGDFSVAFNLMAEQLEGTINNLTCLSEEYKDLSHRDQLTGFYNRYAFFKFAEQVLLQSTRLQKRSTLIIADIDRFKAINDTYGHLCGDEVLKAFCNKILAGLRTKDLCCRYGGEEFLILMPDTALSEGRAVAERLRASVEDMVIEFENHQLRITASFGLTEIQELSDQGSFEHQLNFCIQMADTLLYSAKTEGRNRVAC